MKKGLVLVLLFLNLFGKSKNYIVPEDVIEIIFFLEKEEVNNLVNDYNPFCKKVKKSIISKSLNLKTKKNIKIVIKAILNNKVYINNKWYKIGDKIGEYKIYKILDNEVLFKYNNKIVKKSLIKEGI